MSWTCFSPGIFLDYYSPSSSGTNGKDKLGSSDTLWPAGFTFIVDFDQRISEIPGDGNTGIIAFTAADDIGGFIAAAVTQLPLSHWPVGEWGICGGVYTPNEIALLAERLRGSLSQLHKVLIAGPLKMQQLSEEVICQMNSEVVDTEDVGAAFHWKVLLAVLKNELYIKHETHGVSYRFQDLEAFVRKWWTEVG
jgi:hypothetical protein